MEEISNGWNIFERNLITLVLIIIIILEVYKGTFYSESAGEMWNRHTKVPNIVSGLLFLV